MTFEYKYTEIYNTHITPLEEQLNDYGSKGWELVQVERLHDAPDGWIYHCYFKRIKLNKNIS